MISPIHISDVNLAHHWTSCFQEMEHKIFLAQKYKLRAIWCHNILLSQNLSDALHFLTFTSVLFLFTSLYTNPAETSPHKKDHQPVFRKLPCTYLSLPLLLCLQGLANYIMG